MFSGHRRLLSAGDATAADSHLLMAADTENLTVPLAGLNAAQKQAFDDGLKEFMEKETPEEGLGPVFNGKSCAECHAVPSVGGTEPNLGVARETRIGRRFNGGFDPLDGSVSGSVNRGGGLLQQRAIDLPACKRLEGEVVPQEATIVSCASPQGCLARADGSHSGEDD